MMPWYEIIALIGFPSACLLFLLYYLIDQNQENRKVIKTLTEAINNNTVMMHLVIDRFRLKGVHENKDALQLSDVPDLDAELSK